MKQLILNSPHLFIVVGIPGAGKTFFAEHYAKHYNLPIISNSVTADILFEKPSHSIETQKVVRRLNLNMLGQVLKTKAHTVYDGYTNSLASRQEVSRLANLAGYTPVIVWVQTDLYSAEKRLTGKSQKPAPITPQQFESLAKKFNPPSSKEDYIVISGKHTPFSQKRAMNAKLQPAKIIS